MAHLPSVFVAGLTVFSAMLPEAHAECATDNDCKGDRICEKGACTNPEPEAPAEKAPQPKPEEQLERRSNGLFVGGLAVTITGGVMLTTGIVLLILGPADSDGYLYLAGGIVGGVGLLSLPAGIPMTVIGAERVGPEQAAAVDIAPWASSESGGVIVTTTW